MKSLGMPLVVSLVLHVMILFATRNLPALAAPKSQIVEMTVVKPKPPPPPPPPPPPEPEKKEEPKPEPPKPKPKIPKPVIEAPKPPEATPPREEPQRAEPPPPPKGFSVDMSNTVATGEGAAVPAIEGGGNMFADPRENLPPAEKTTVRPPPPPQQGTKDGVGRGAPRTYSPPEWVTAEDDRIPPYPAAAKRAEIEGTVQLKVCVGTDGRVDDVKVMRGLGYGCDEIAVEYAKDRWKFKPALVDGQPVAKCIPVPVVFVLER